MDTRAAAVLLALTACTAPSPSAPAHDSGDSAAAEPEADLLDLGPGTPRNLVVVTVDTLRADALPAWGSTRETTPRMDMHAWQRVDHAVATASWTVPSTASLLTGVDLPEHGLRSLSLDGAQGTLAVPSFASHLSQAGFQTAAMTGSELFLVDHLGLATGFDLRDDIQAEPGNAEATVAAAAEWLQTLDPERPFFLYLQPVDPHAPYRPTDADLGTWADLEMLPFDIEAEGDVQSNQIAEKYQAMTDDAERAEAIAAVRAVYDEQILGVDRAVDSLIAALRRTGHDDDTLVVLTADHGESFFDGEPAMLGHGTAVRHELVQVPLMFWGAGVPEGEVDCVASNMDILPTALDVMDLAPLPGTEGRSLLQGCRDHAFSSVYEVVNDAQEWLSWVSVERDGLQVARNCHTGQALAYDLVADPRATRPMDVALVDGAGLLLAELDLYASSVEARLPVTCSRTPPGPRFAGTDTF